MLQYCCVCLVLFLEVCCVVCCVQKEKRKEKTATVLVFMCVMASFARIGITFLFYERTFQRTTLFVLAVVFFYKPKWCDLRGAWRSFVADSWVPYEWPHLQLLSRLWRSFVAYLWRLHWTKQNLHSLCSTE